MKLKIFISVSVIAVVTLIAFSQMKRKAFAPAEDFPRDALVYVQIADLPAFIRLWNESKFKERYVGSENFRDFSNRHLGLKLASRWREFGDAAGFSFDFETLGGLTENQASVALYDIGRLEFVFIAPVSSELFAATKFMQNQAKFSEDALEDGTIIYRANVEADRGRQSQELIFTHVKGKFVLATSEKLLAQTLANLSGAKTKNRLTDEPSFNLLSEKSEPRAISVWVNQKVLNDDYYFQRYWLMSDVANLKNIRAGIFDFEMQEGKLIERRRFLLNQEVVSSPPSLAQTAEMLAFLPANVPFYRLENANSKTVDDAIEKTISSRRPAQTQRKSSRLIYSSFESFNDSYRNYNSLGEDFSETIDETDVEDTTERKEIDVDFSKTLEAARPRAVLTFTEPKVLPAPLFVEFRRGVIFRLDSPAAFNHELFESEIEKSLAAKVFISAPNARLKWETKTENDAARRELELPMLDWKIIYTLRGRHLIVADSAEMLAEIVAGKSQIMAKTDFPIDALTVINLGARENAYDLVFDELAGKNAAHEFFSGNIKSLLDAAANVEKIEIRERYLQNTLEEELTVYFNQED